MHHRELFRSSAASRSVLTFPFSSPHPLQLDCLRYRSRQLGSVCHHGSLVAGGFPGFKQGGRWIDRRVRLPTFPPHLFLFILTPLYSYTTSGGDPYQEWASNSGGVNTTLQLSFSSAVSIAQIVLYDRCVAAFFRASFKGGLLISTISPNTNDWITGGLITFANGGVITIPSLINNGSALILNLATPISSASFVFKVTSVGPSSQSVGLSEIQVFSAA